MTTTYTLPQNNYFTLFEKMADPVMLIKDDCFINCNEASLKQLGYPNKTTFLNQYPWDISPEYQADGLKSKEKSQAMNALALQNGFHRFDWLHLCYNGDIISVEVTLTSIVVKNETLLCVVWRDSASKDALVNKLKKSSALQDAIFRAHSETITY